MPPRTVVCPSGLTVVVRPWRVAELNILGDEKSARNGDTVDRAVQACIEEVTSPGVYPLPPAGGKPSVADMLVCDRFVLLLHVRVATHGEEYLFDVQCANPVCRERYEWGVNLIEGMTVKPLPDASREAFVNGNKLQTTVAGKRITYRLLTGRLERAAPTDRSRSVTMALDARILEVEGVHVNDKRMWLDKMEGGDAADLLATFDESDGGVETALDVECPKCGRRDTAEFPFGRSFFVPKRRPRAH